MPSILCAQDMTERTYRLEMWGLNWALHPLGFDTFANSQLDCSDLDLSSREGSIASRLEMIDPSVLAGTKIYG